MLKLVIQIGIVYASGVSTAVVAVSRVIKSPRGVLDALLGDANLFRKTFSGLDCVEVREWL
jgi:hypothetical protein